jgi:hypothetical protein
MTQHNAAAALFKQHNRSMQICMPRTEKPFLCVDETIDRTAGNINTLLLED